MLQPESASECFLVLDLLKTMSLWHYQINGPEQYFRVCNMLYLKPKKAPKPCAAFLVVGDAQRNSVPFTLKRMTHLTQSTGPLNISLMYHASKSLQGLSPFF